jgi:hypothetical protein
MLTSNAAGRQLMDIYKSSTAVFIASGMSLVFCLIYIFAMSAFAEYIAWAVVAIV